MFKYRQERIAMIRFYLKMQETHHELFGRTSVDSTCMLVEWIVSLGHLEDKPFNSSKISSYLGLPRSTVLRKLAILKGAGLIVEKEKHYYLHPKYMNLSDESYHRVFDAIHNLSHEISKSTELTRVAS